MSTEENWATEVADPRARFDAACSELRPELHRFCARMTGSAADGEDVLQDVLVHAFCRLSELRDQSALRSWLFRIAHNKCIDCVRARRPVEPLEDDRDDDARPLDDSVDDRRCATLALTHIVTDLPPKERAAVVLKDVLDLSLEEVAEVTESNVGAVKAALHRGRAKLERAPLSPRRRPIPEPERTLVERYVAAFNLRDWDGVRALLSDDARVEVVDRAEGLVRDARYFVNYGRLLTPWRLALAHVDGAEVIVHFRRSGDAWIAQSIVDLSVAGGAVHRIRDYLHVDYLLSDAVVDP